MKSASPARPFRSAAIALLGILVLSGAEADAAATVKAWQNFKFFGSTRTEVRKKFGKPEDSGGMDTYLISDSPDLMVMGLVGYEKGRVVAVSAVLRPKLTYKKVRDIQAKSEEVRFVSETKEGTLFKFKKPSPNGPVYLAISPSDDKKFGCYFMESVENPFGGAKPAKATGKKARIDLSLLEKDDFDWQLLDEEGRLEMLGRIKDLWRATGVETAKNAVPAKDLLERITFSDQSLVVDRACVAAGIDPAPFRKMRAEASKQNPRT